MQMEGNNSSHCANATCATNVTTHSSGGVAASNVGLTLSVLSDAKVTLIIKCTVLLAISLVGAFGNTLTFFAVLKTPSLWTKSNMLIANQSVADAYLCGIQLPLFIAVQLSVYVFSARPCNYQRLVAVVFVITKQGPHIAMFNLIPVAVDRYVAIVHPFYYDARVTETTIKMAIFVGWTYSLLVVGAFFVYFVHIDWSACSVPYSVLMNAIADTAAYVSVSVTMVFVYGKILRIAMAQRKRVTERWQDTPAVVERGSAQTAGDGPIRELKVKAEANRRKEFKAARLTAALLFSVIVMWLPFHVSRWLQAAGNTHVYAQNLQDIGVALGLFNAATDWIIYGVMNTQFRNAFARILGIKRRRRDDT